MKRRHVDRFITATSAARALGWSHRYVDRLCRSGRFVGCRFDPVTWQWLILLPIRIIGGRWR